MNMRQIIQEHERKVNKPPFGYPVALISTLINKVLSAEKEKSKWKALAQRRGELLNKIQELSTLTKFSEEELLNGFGNSAPVPIDSPQDSNLPQTKGSIGDG
jgi:hypothetical protein